MCIVLTITHRCLRDDTPLRVFGPIMAIWLWLRSLKSERGVESIFTRKTNLLFRETPDLSVH